MEVFIDVIIVENFLVNFFLLYITSQTLRLRIKVKDLVIPSILAGVYTITILIEQLSFLNNFVVKILVAVIFTVIAFKRKDIGFIIKSTLVYIGYSMVLAAICFFIDISTKKNDVFSYNVIDFSYKKLLIAIIILYLVCHRLAVFLEDRKSLNKYIFKVEIIDKDWKTEIRAFLDTGNELREPATNLPVIIVEESKITDYKLSEKDIFYVPYQAINGHKGKLRGFKPLGVKIFLEKGNVQFRDAIVCISTDKLSSTGDYEALLSRGII